MNISIYNCIKPYANIKYNDIANGYGVRTSLFVSGCRNNCPNCFNKEAQNFKYGNPFTDEVANKIIESIKADHYKGITILGGEPMEPENASQLIKFVKKFREVYGDTKDIWLFTGYIYEDLLQHDDDRTRLAEAVDIIVDGPFIEAKKSIILQFRGSSNQRIIDAKNKTDITSQFK